MSEPLVALSVQTPTVNGAQSYEQGAGAKSDLNAAHLQQAQASIGLMGQVALGAMGGDVNGQVDPQKWAQGQALLKAHGINMTQYGPQVAPMLARASISTLAQLQQANNQRDFELSLAQFGNTMKQQAIANRFDAAKFNADQHSALTPNSMFGVTTPDAIRAQSGLPPVPMLNPDGTPIDAGTGTTPPPAQPTGTTEPGVGGATAAPVAAVPSQNPPTVGDRATELAAATGAPPPAATPTGKGIMGIPEVQIGADGKPDATQQAAFLQALPPALADLVKKAGNYQLSPSQMFTLRNGNDRAMFDAVMARYDPTYDANLYPARAGYLKSVTSGAISTQVNSASTSIGHLAQLAESVKKLNNSDYPMWNSVANATKTQTGQPEVTNFDVNAKAVTDELAKFFKGTGATDVGSIESWHSSLDHNGSQAQLNGAIDTAIGLLKSRMDVLEQQYVTTMGHPPAAGYAQFMRPDAQQGLIALGYNPITLEKTGVPAPDAPAGGATSAGSGVVDYSHYFGAQ